MIGLSKGFMATGGGNADGQRPFRLTSLFHPSFHVPDLTEAEQWYLRVFGQSSARLSTGPQIDPDNRWDYSTFTMIRDLLLDSIDPTLMIKEGKQQYATVDEPHLMGLGWFVEGMPALYRVLQNADIEVVGLLGEHGTDDVAPTSALRRSDGGEGPDDENASPGPMSPLMYFTVPDDVGLRYQFSTPISIPQDPRSKEGWALGPRREGDPLGIDFTSHHTILTARPQRAQRLLVDLLGGQVIHRGRNEARGTSSTYVRLADGVYEIAVPDIGTLAHADLARTLPRDCYHAITFKVADLDEARRHLESQSVEFRADTGSFLVTDPNTSMGVPWGFTSEAIPTDDRAEGFRPTIAQESVSRSRDSRTDQSIL